MDNEYTLLIVDDTEENIEILLGLLEDFRRIGGA